eukprot:gene31024-biopygen5636
MNGAELLSYDEVKHNWEKSAFKIINQVVYVRIDGQGIRHVTSEKTLQEAFRHLGYVDITLRDSGSVSVSRTQPFIPRWIKDTSIRKYDDMKLMPPPIEVGGNVYNIWNGFEVERDMSSHDDSVMADHPSVEVFIEFLHTLCGNNQECTDYILNWIAQIFQQPAQKTGVAILLKGEEGVGKNRATDLLRGNTEYFNHLSGLIDDAESRVAFYKFLMARDIKGVEWIRSRPATTYMSQMVSMNLPYEHQFILHMIQGLSVEHNNVVDSIIDYSPSVSIKAETLFDQ